MKYDWEMKEINKIFRYMLMSLLLGFPILGFFIYKWLGALCGYVLASLIDLFFPRWAVDYPIENMAYTLQVFEEHGACNGWIECRWPGDKRVRICRWCRAYITDKNGKVNEPSREMPIRKYRWSMTGMGLYFRQKDWIRVQSNESIKALDKICVFNRNDEIMDGHHWVGLISRHYSDWLQVIRYVTGTNRISLISAMVPLRPELVFASTDEKGDRIDGLPDMRKSKDYWDKRREEERLEAKLQKRREEQRVIDRNRREAEQQRRKKHLP